MSAKVYEIRDGTGVLGQFSVRTKAVSFKRQCSAEPSGPAPGTDGAVSGRTLKSIARLLKPLGISEILIHQSSVYVVDPAAFDSELGRVRGILNGGRRMNSSEQAIRLYGKDGDLMMSGRNPQGYAFRADVGDGNEGDGSFYCYSYLRVLADMFRLSDSQCTLSMDDDYPLEGTCRMGDIELTMLIAPMRGE